MPKLLRRVSGKEAIAALERLGFIQIRQRGSHVVMKKQGPTDCCDARLRALCTRTAPTLRGPVRPCSTTAYRSYLEDQLAC